MGHPFGDGTCILFTKCLCNLLSRCLVRSRSLRGSPRLVRSLSPSEAWSGLLAALFGFRASGPRTFLGCWHGLP